MVCNQDGACPDEPDLFSRVGMGVRQGQLVSGQALTAGVVGNIKRRPVDAQGSQFDSCPDKFLRPRMMVRQIDAGPKGNEYRLVAEPCASFVGRTTAPAVGDALTAADDTGLVEIVRKAGGLRFFAGTGRLLTPYGGLLDLKRRPDFGQFHEMIPFGLAALFGSAEGQAGQIGFAVNVCHIIRHVGITGVR